MKDSFLSKNLKKLFGVNVFNLIGYAVLTIILTIRQLADLFIASIDSDSNTLSFSQVIGEQFGHYINSLQNNNFVMISLLFLAMALVGVLVFGISRFILRLLLGTYEHYEESTHYYLTKDFSLGEYWITFIISVILHLLAVVALVCYSIFWYSIILPTTRTVFDQAINNAGTPVYELLVAALALFLSLHVFTILLRFLASRFSD